MNSRVSFAVVGFVLICAIRGIADPVACGERFTLRSKILGEERTVYISVPVSYAQGTQKYPVLYLTDAQWQFDQTRTSVAFLARNGLIPEIIVVGVASSDRTRDLYATKADFKVNGRTIPFPTSGNADQFLEFLEKELIPGIESTYRTTPLRILAGHSAGGNFALHTMRVRPGLFQAIIAASPWLGWDAARELKQPMPFLESTEGKTRGPFLTTANDCPQPKPHKEPPNSGLRARQR